MPEIRETAPQYKSRDELAKLFDAWLKKKYKNLSPEAYSNLRLYYKLFLKETGYQERPAETEKEYSQRIAQGLEAGGGQLPYQGNEDLESRFPGYFELKAPSTFGKPSSDPKDYYWTPKKPSTTQAPAATTSAADLKLAMTEPMPWYWDMMTPDQQRVYLEKMLNQGTMISPSDRLQESMNLQQMQLQREQFELSRQPTAYQQAEMERWRRLDELAQKQYEASLSARPYSWIERFMYESPGKRPPAPSFLPKFAPGEAAGQPLKGTGLQTPNVFTALNTPQTQREMLEAYSDFFGEIPWSDKVKESLSRQGFGNAPRGRSY